MSKLHGRAHSNTSLVLLLAALMLAALVSSASAENALGIPQAEYDALVALYNATDGLNWGNHENWLTENSPWYGVTIESGHVTEISLGGNGLSGTIPPEIGDLPSLGHLDLGFNQLTGEIPAEIGDLSSLWALALWHNQLSGPIPAQTWDLTGLEALVLGANHLTGPVPSAVGSLTELLFLDLSENLLSGPIPPEIGNLTDLLILWLHGNRFAGPIPHSIVNLVHIGDDLEVPEELGEPGNISYNALASTDPAVRAFLAQKAPDWANTQTVPPADVHARVPEPGRVVVSWTPIPYTGDEGYYEVGVSTTPGGPYSFSEADRTSNKAASSITLTEMPEDVDLYLVVRTVTLAGAHNQSTLTSGFSNEVSVWDPGLTMRIGEAKHLPDGETVVIANVPATIGWLESATTVKGYIQEWDRSAGIAVRIPVSLVNMDESVCGLGLIGVMATRDGERYIDVSEVHWSFGDEPDIRPLGIANFTGARGHDITGMYIKTWGKVIESPAYGGGTSPSAFRMSDGSGEFTVLWPQNRSEFGDNRLLVPAVDAFIPVSGVCSGVLGEKLLYFEPEYDIWRLSSQASGSECRGYACIEDNFSRATAMEISGPGIDGWQPMTGSEDEEWGHVDWRYWWDVPTPRPALPAEYLFRITQNGQASIYKGWLTAYLTEPPTNLLPSADSHVSGPLIFSWTLPSEGGPFESRMALRSDGALYDFWSEDEIRGTSCTYDGPPLSGHYSWRVEVFDRDGNSCTSERVSFYYDPVLPLP